MFRLRWCALLVMLGMAQGLDAASFLVTTTADSIDTQPGDGQCADAEGHCSLRAAIQEANALAGEDTITLNAGTFLLTQAGTGEDASAHGDLDVTDTLEIVGAGAAATLIDAGALDRVLDLPAGPPRTLRLGGLALRNGRLSGPTGTLTGNGGAAIRVAAGATLLLSHVDIRDNHAVASVAAAAIDNKGCIQGDHVRILDNTDSEGAGSGNAISGGIVIDGATTCLVLEDSEISGNRGDLSGALYVLGGASVTLRRTLVANNASRNAGAFELNVGGDVLLENVTLSGNAGEPGAILVDGQTRLLIVNSTITGNHALIGVGTWGAILDMHGGFGRTTLRNTILAGNGPGVGADDCSNATSLGGNLIGSTRGCNLASVPSDQLDVAAGLSPLADHGGFSRTHLPGPNAIDHAIADGCMATDQRGFPRPVDGDGDGSAGCDVGAVEISIDDTIFVDAFELPMRPA